MIFQFSQVKYKSVFMSNLQPQYDRVFGWVRLRREEPEVQVGVVDGTDGEESCVALEPGPLQAPDPSPLPRPLQVVGADVGGEEGGLAHLVGGERGLLGVEVEEVPDRWRTNRIISAAAFERGNSISPQKCH